MIQHPIVLTFVLFLGACIGSFLNVVIYRVPRNLNVGKPARSFCPACERQIPWYLNLPILSWILLRGRCAFCSAPISVRYVLVEAATMLLFLAIWQHAAPTGGWGPALTLWILVALLLASSFIDFEHQIIPDSLNFGGTAAAIVLATTLPLLDQAFPLAGILSVAPESDGLPNAVWYRGLMWSVIGAAVGYGLIWSVVQLGKLAFGRMVHEYDKEQDWIIHQPNPEENPRLDIGEDSFFWEDLFNRPTDKLVIETGQVTMQIKDQDAVQERTIVTEELTIQDNRIAAGGETLGLESVQQIAGKSKRIVQPREAMGFGDVKFVMMIGAFLGWQATIFTLIAGSLVGAAVGLLQKRLGGERWSQPIPFGPYLAIGALIFVFYGPQIMNWYFSRAGLG